MKYLKIILFVFSIILLTIITEIGGFILLLCIPLFRFSKRKFTNQWVIFFSNTLIFIILYSCISIFIVPHIAQKFGKEPMPIYQNKNVKPEIGRAHV